MCGIVGKYSLSGNSPISPVLIQAMSDKIVYRGPDDGGVFTDGPVGLGHRRLSILDLSHLGHQPMASPDKKVWITYNGEIYNFLSLKKDLENKGYTFRSNCDTEVIINLYIEYGVACLEKMRGMFAFAIWDVEKETLFLARDRIGKKPLYYFFNGKAIVFASEIKSILADPSVGKEINYEAFSDFFKYMYVPDPKTIYKDIFKLKPGHYLLCSKEGVSEKEYWDISFTSQTTQSTDNVADELLEILEESVRIRHVSDVPLGAFLSGGIDSSGIVALMARQQNSPVTTCSIGFDSDQYDETRFARKIAKQYHTDHHEFTVHQNAQEILRKLVHHFDEPFGDSSAVPTYYVSQLARQQVTVALSGDGGDENFAGYEKYYTDNIENKIRACIPSTISSTMFSPLAGLFAGFHGRYFQKAATLLHGLSRGPDYGFYLTNTDFNTFLWDATINDDVRQKIGSYNPFSVTEHYYNKADTDNHLAKILYTDLKTYLPGDILVKVDRMSMAHSLEVRAPILDHKVIEYAASIPSQLKYKDGEKKYILKEAFKKILPNEIMYRKKMGLSVPLADWFRGELFSVGQESILGKDSSLNHFFRPEKLASIWNLHQTGKRNYSAILWNLLMFELWFKEYMD